MTVLKCETVFLIDGERAHDDSNLKRGPHRPSQKVRALCAMHFHNPEYCYNLDDVWNNFWTDKVQLEFRQSTILRAAGVDMDYYYNGERTNLIAKIVGF